MANERAYGVPDTRPEPVKVAGQVASAIAAVVTFLVSMGVLTMGAGDEINNGVAAILIGITGVVSIVATISAALHARNKVTPLADPRTSDGTPLVRQNGP